MQTPPGHTSNTDWQTVPGWQNARIRTRSGSGTWALWLFAILWSAATSHFLVTFPGEFKSGNYASAITLLFPLIGLFLFYKAGQRTLRYKRHGDIELLMDPFPGAIGGHVGGSVELKSDYDPEHIYMVQLECVLSTLVKGEREYKRVQDVHWRISGEAHTERIGRGTRLSFRFGLPAELPESDINNGGEYFFWRLIIRANLPGPDLHHSFNIPVFATAAQSEHISNDTVYGQWDRHDQQKEQLEIAISRGDFTGTPLAETVRLVKADRQVRLYYPMFNNLLPASIALIFSSGFGFAASRIFLVRHGDLVLMSPTELIINIALVFAALVSLAAAIYLPLSNLRITIGKGKIEIMKRILFLPVFRKRLNSREIRALEIQPSKSVGKTKRPSHYFIQAGTKSEKNYTIAEGIEDEYLAELLKEYLDKRIRSTY